MKSMQEIVKSVGHGSLIVTITLVSIAASVLVTFLAAQILGRPISNDAWFLCVLTPSIVAPFASWYPIRLLVTINSLEEEMRALATYDVLTKVMTRRAFIDHAEQHLKWAHRYGQGFSVLMIDIDHFKKINDSFGHAAGDSVLASFGRLLNTAKRDSDLCGRMGGEEFTLLLPSTDLDTAVKFSDKLMDAIRHERVVVGQLKIPYTVSIGIDQFVPDAAQEIDKLLEHADRAMYAAKESGRDRVACYGSAMQEATRMD